MEVIKVQRANVNAIYVQGAIKVDETSGFMG